MSSEKWSAQPQKATAALTDEVLIIDNAGAPTNLVSKRVLISGLPLGEINNGVNLGSGSQVFSTKTGLNLNFRTLLPESGRIGITQGTDDISFTLTTNAVLTNQANSYTAGFKQSFVASGTTAGLNLNNSEPNAPTSGDVWRNVNLIKYEDQGSISRTLVDLSLAQTLVNKTLTTPIIGNFTNATHTHATDIQGGLLTNSALTSGVFGSITGIGTQTQTLNMNTNTIINSDLPTGSIKFIDTTKKLGFNISAINASSTTTIIVPNSPTPNISLVSTSDGKIAISNLADGTVGQLISWTAAGSPTIITNGTSGQILTVNAGDTPSFQTPDVGVLSINSDTTAAQSLIQSANEILINSSGGGFHTFTAGSKIVQLTGAQTLEEKTLVTPTISGTGFTNAQHAHTGATSGGQLVSTAALSDTVNIAYLNTSNTYNTNSRQDFTPDLAQTAGLNVGSIAGVPNSQTNADIWYDSTVPSVFARIDGSDVDLGVTENFAWSADHSATNFNLTNTGAVVFSLSPVSTPASTTNFLLAGSAGITMNVPDTDVFDINVFGTSEYTFSNTIFDMKANSLQNVLQIQDSNSNEQLTFSSVASALNSFKITNSATGVGPTIESEGETNVDFNIKTKGTGEFKVNGNTVSIVSGSIYISMQVADPVSAPELITITTANIPVDFDPASASWTEQSTTSNFSLTGTSNGEITYSGSESVSVLISYEGALGMDANNNNINFLSVAKNGTEITGSRTYDNSSGTANEVHNFSNSVIETLAMGNTIKLLVANASASNNLVTVHGTMTITVL